MVEEGLEAAHKELLEEFHRARREGQKLSLALGVLRWDGPQKSEAGQELLKYLSYRRRSAVMELIRTGDLAGLKAMGARDWLEKQYLSEYREEARKQNETEIWAWLYRLEYAAERPSSAARPQYAAERPSFAAGPQAAPAKPSSAVRLRSGQTPVEETAQLSAHRARLCSQVWKLTIRKLRLRLPGLSEALSALRFAADSAHFSGLDKTIFLAGEGFTVWYRQQELLEAYGKAPDQILRSLMHLILHNMYLHPLRGEGKDIPTWNLACDMAVEHLLDGWEAPGLTAGTSSSTAKISRSTVKASDFGARRFGVLSEIPERPGREYRVFLLKEYHLQPPSGQAEGIYRYLREANPQEAVLKKLEEAYRVDDHSLWSNGRADDSGQAEASLSGDSSQQGADSPQEEAPPPGSGGQGMGGASQDKEGAFDKSRFLSFWSRMAREWSPHQEGQHQKAGLLAGKDSQEVQLRKKEGYDYRRFLEKFMVCQEEVELDLDSFDYLPYWYSRTHYEGIVLLEPLEYKEVHKLDEMVIAIDTSGSCSGRVVQRFLEETYQILTSRGNFFHKMHVHIIQCDSMIQEHVVIHSREEFLDYMDQVKVKGLGGTDFRPVFTLVDQMIQDGEIRDLKGLLYFTDGDGVYPTVKPAYETAFIFLNRAYEKHEVPEWGIRLNLGLRMEDI